ncbi:unnamed protein product, partial [Choristocarpus tenellus]
ERGGCSIRGLDRPGLDEASRGRILTCYQAFHKLTSVHINSTDRFMMASGYSNNVRLFDLETSKVVREFHEVHTDHINISRFANHSPFMFATSSFDCTVKAWDARRGRSPIYSCKSDNGHVMLCFRQDHKIVEGGGMHPDDVFLLTSAIDNEVKQYLALDGRLHMKLDIPKRQHHDNFTRSYYTSSGRLILSGSSEEQTVRLHCAQTGNLIHSAEMYPGRKHSSLYVQSLRGDPHHDFQFSVLVNYRDTAYPLEIVHVDMLKGSNGDDLSSITSYTSSSCLSADLGRACVEKEGADCCLVAHNRARYLGHAALLSCRSPMLRKLFSREGHAKFPGGDGEPVLTNGTISGAATSTEATASDVRDLSYEEKMPRSKSVEGDVKVLSDDQDGKRV